MYFIHGPPVFSILGDGELRACVNNLQPRIGDEAHALASRALGVRDYAALANMMLDYYDRLYDYHRTTNTSRRRGVVVCESVNAAVNAETVVRALH